MVQIKEEIERQPPKNEVKSNESATTTTNEEAAVPEQSQDVQMKPADPNVTTMDAKKRNTERPQENANPSTTAVKPEIKKESVEPSTPTNGTTEKLRESPAKPDEVMTNDHMSPIERHEALVSKIREAILSEFPPEKVAEQMYHAASSHADRDRLLLSTFHSILPTIPIEGALRLIDISTHLPYPTRHTIALIEALTKTLTTDSLSGLLPALQPRINKIRTRPKADIFLIKLLRSLISRDPHAANPVLLGSLKLLIASALPPWHPSGQNKRGQYNTHVLPLIPTPAEPALARALTSFTEACRYPPGCEKPAGWVPAREGLRVLLDAFDVGKLTEIQTLICVQAAILFQHLEFDGGTFGKSLFNGGEGVALRKRVMDGLDSGFRRFVMVLLNRERRWVRWKKTMEHTKKPKVEIARPFKRRMIRQPRLQARGIEGMGMPELSWKIFLEANETGGLDALMEEVKEDKNEAEEDKRKGDSKYVWRALRTLCDENVELMGKVANEEGKVDLERIVSEEVRV